MPHLFRASALFMLLAASLAAAEPVVIPLWPDKPPQFLENAPAEITEARGSIRNVTVPSISLFLPPAEKRTGMAIIVCAGGGYGALDWKTHVIYAADVFNPKGVAVIGLKYRLRPPHKVDNAVHLTRWTMRVFRRSPCSMPNAPCASCEAAPPSGASIPIKSASPAIPPVAISP